MNLTELKGKKTKPLRDLIAFIWLKPKKLKFGLILPDTIYNTGYRMGRFSIGKVFAVGPKAWQIKKGDRILVHEYGMIGEKGFKENFIYFIEEKEVFAKVSGAISFIQRIVPKGIEEHAAKA